jgi:hypothetical protein
MHLYLKNEPDFFNELVDTLQNNTIPEEVKETAMKIFKSLLNDDVRLNSILTLLGCNVNHGVIPTLVRRLVAIFISNHEEASFSERFIKSLFSLLVAIIATTTGAQYLNQSGVIATLIPLITHRNPNLPESKVSNFIFFFHLMVMF